MRLISTRRSIAVLLCTGMLLAGCAGGATQAPTTAPSAAPASAAPASAAPSSATGDLTGKKIAFLSQGASNEWAIQLDAVAQEAVKKTGAELVYFDAAGNADNQVTQMQDAASLGVDAIVVVPLGAGALVAQSQRAMAAGIPVIDCVTSVADESAYTSFVGWDWKGMYARGTEWLAQQLGGKGNIIMLNGMAGAGTSDLAQQGAKEVLAKYPDIKVVGEGYTDWSIAKAKQLTETFIAKGVKIDGIYVNGGEPATGSIQAFADAKLPMPLQTGTTEQNGALRVLLENKVKFYGIPSPPSASFTCIDVAAKILRGEQVEKTYYMTELGGFKDFTEAEVCQKYQPQYADGYQEPTDTYLTQDQLKQFNLLNPNWTSTSTPVPCPWTATASPSAGASTAGADGSLTGKKVAFLSQGASNEWAIQFDEVAKAEAKRLGAELLYFDSQGSLDKQIKDMEDALALGANAIVLYPQGAGALVGQVERSAAQGVPVVLCGGRIDTDKNASTVTVDWATHYAAAAEWLAKELNYKGNIVWLDGAAGVSDSEEAGAAAHAVMAKYPDIKIVGQGYSDWSVAKAKQLTETFLAKGVPIDGAYTHGAEPAIGLLQAYKDAGKTPPPVAGTGAQNGALRLFKESGTKFYGVNVPPAQSAGCIDVAGMILRGEPVDKLYDVSALMNLKDFNETDLNAMYQPQYGDGYLMPSDQYMTQDQLKQFNLTNPNYVPTPTP